MFEVDLIDYAIADTSQIITPALVVFREPLEANLRKMIEIARGVERLRPHCKTHKMAAVCRLELELGITKHKCATLAEAEMLAEAGARDIFWAYNPVGANVARTVEFTKRYPQVKLLVTVDHERTIETLATAFRAADGEIEVLLDIDTGQHRTGVPAGPLALKLYEQIVNTPGLVAGGLHVYDGQNHQTSRDEREAAVHACWQPVAALRKQLVERSWPVPRVVAGGTGSFPIWAAIDEPTIEASPGTCVFHDIGYCQMFPDLLFRPAAMLLTRVVSRPTPNRVTLDLGYKACASDPPAGRRLYFPALPDAKEALQNEEHLVLETEQADAFAPGDELLAIPRHICPTSALHKQAYVVADGKLVDRWEVTSRDRWLTI